MQVLRLLSPCVNWNWCKPQDDHHAVEQHCEPVAKTGTNSMDTLINCYKFPCRQQQSKLVNLEAERDEKSAIKLCTLVVSVRRQCFLYISIFIAVHSRSFHAKSNIRPKLICWQLFHILNISISSQTHPRNEILSKGKSTSISKLFYWFSQPKYPDFLTSIAEIQTLSKWISIRHQTTFVISSGISEMENAERQTGSSNISTVHGNEHTNKPGPKKSKQNIKMQHLLRPFYWKDISLAGSQRPTCELISNNKYSSRETAFLLWMRNWWHGLGKLLNVRER